MKTKNVNLLFALVAVLLFGFSCFCISRMNQTNNQLINCRNHVLEFKETMLRLKNKSENNHQNLVKVLHQLKHKVAPVKPSGSILEKKVNMLDQDETVFNQFEVLKFFLPHLRTAGNIYPDIAIGRQRAGVSFALGITTIDRGNHTYLKQTLTSVLSRMTPEEEEDSVVIVSVADTDENYLKSVVHMVKTRAKPIDVLLDDIALLRMCSFGGPLRSCLQLKREVRVQYKPSLFQHVGTHSSFPGREQHLKDHYY